MLLIWIKTEGWMYMTVNALLIWIKKEQSTNCSGYCNIRANSLPWIPCTQRIKFLFLCSKLVLCSPPFWMRILHLRLLGLFFFFLFIQPRSSHIPSSRMVHAMVLFVFAFFVDGIHQSRTWISGSFESVQQMHACTDQNLVYIASKRGVRSQIRAVATSKRRSP